MSKAFDKIAAGLTEALEIARGNAKPSKISFVITAAWDGEAQVWTVESPDLPGLITEVSSLGELDTKLPNLIRDIMD